MKDPILLVCDDVALVAVVRRLLEREGRESILATSVADALIAYGHSAPRLVILDPSVEGQRGRVVLEELAKQPGAGRAAVLLIGSEVEGWSAPFAPLPLEGGSFLRRLASVEGERNNAHASAHPVQASPPAPTWWLPTSSATKRPLPTAIRRPRKSAYSQQHSPHEPSAVDGEARVSSAESSIAPEPTGLVSPEVALPTAREGRLTLEQLAQLVAQLCTSRASVCLVLQSADATRTLWLKGGRLTAAASSLYEESLLSRARADGLLDREQEKELRRFGTASPSELIRAMRAAGYLREVEVVPLVQRNAEHIALEALSQDESAYRLSVEEIDGRAAATASPSPLLQLVPRALERTMSAESVLVTFGGLDAVPIPRQPPSVLESFGLTGAELELLSAADGAATVGELLLGSTLSQEQALKTLMLARLLGGVEVRAGSSSLGLPGPPVDIRRLKSKFEEIQEADYFAILGVPRSAGSEEVRQAFQVLSAEFNPMKFAGHPDPTLQAQAEQVQGALAEAALTLQDDRLRAAYAGNLVD